MQTVLTLVVAAVVLPLGSLLGQGPAEEMPEGCTRESPKIVACEWQFQVAPGVEVTRRPVPTMVAAMVEVRITSPPPQSWNWWFEGTRPDGNVTYSPGGGCRLCPEPEAVRVRYFEFNATRKYDFVLGAGHYMFGVGTTTAASPTSYTVAARFFETIGTEIAASRAGSPADPQLLDGTGDAGAPYADLAGGWFDDPILDDGRMEMGLVVPQLSAVPREGAEEEIYDLDWSLLGERYRVSWYYGYEGLGGSFANSLEAKAWRTGLFRISGPTELFLITNLEGEIDYVNGTLTTRVPLRALGDPAVGAPFSNITARVTYFSYYSHRALQTQIYDSADSQVRPFALGGPDLWARLRGEAPVSFTVAGGGDPLPPWVLWAAVGAVAVLLAAGASGFLVLARRQKLTVVKPSPPAPGAVFLSKYHVERELGRGSFGSTWLATHLNLRRHVVIKQLHPEWSAVPEAIERFRQEARILAELDHPHVTRVYDVELVEGTWYIVMEYVDGGSLDQQLARGPLRSEEASRIALGVLDGLAYLHDKGVLHLDLKPSNVLLSSTGIVKIVDFGVAHSRTSLAAPEGGSPPGTPAFMAPEQIAGSAPDARSDLYAVAVTYYELVTGKFYLDVDLDDLFATRKAILEGRPALPLRHLNLQLNAWLERGLAKNPDRRFQNAWEMKSALFEASSLAVGAPPSRPSRGRGTGGARGTRTPAKKTPAKPGRPSKGSRSRR